MNESARILLVEDDPTFRSLLVTILKDQGYETVEKEDGKAALMMLQRQSFDLVLSDLRLPGLGGLELYRKSVVEGINPPFILLTAFGTVEEAVAAIKEGVADFLTKPLKDPETLRTLVRRTLEANRRERSLALLQEREVSGLPPDAVLFAGQAMDAVRRLVAEVAPTQATVLLSGESGTGKELAARYIHLASQRREGPFVALNCAAIPETLLESELFGHEKGAFTGATQVRVGRFELASGGTIFLDEIGELPLSLQVKLLRVLQERCFERVGGQREIRADVRIIAATNRNLLQEVRERRFREDLYYRLYVFPITLPPLRERRDGMAQLSEYLVRRVSQQTGSAVPVLDAELLETLVAYDWPGNIRELQNVLERAVILGRDKLSLAELPEAIVRAAGAGSVTTTALYAVEREAIVAALAACSGNRRQTAQRLGISLRTLQYRIKEYGLLSD